MDQATANLGLSVVARVSGIERKGIPGYPQPTGGLLDPATAARRFHPDLLPPFERRQENVSPALVGLAVDYLTRLSQGAPPEKAFEVSLRGASIVGVPERAEELLGQVAAGGPTAVAPALRLASYDRAYRSGLATFIGECQEPNAAVVGNVCAMVSYMKRFFDVYGPVVVDGPTFEGGGYTDCVCTGDADYLCRDALWDMKVSSYPPTAEHTLQLLVYWRMGLHSAAADLWGPVRYVGVANPRTATTYRWDLARVAPEVVSEVDREVIGYGTSRRF